MNKSNIYAPWNTGRRDFEEIQNLVLGTVEESELSKRILFVAASGFFTGGM